MRLRAALAALVLVGFPLAALAAPFGGQISASVFCADGVVMDTVGPPNGGVFLWSPSTQTYSFGPPNHAGQWVLGLTSGAPYFCLISILPLITEAGIVMTMVGTSR